MIFTGMPPTSPVSPQTPHTPSPLILPNISRMPSTSSTGTTPMLPVPPPMPSARLNAPRPPMPRLVSDPARPPPPYQRVDTPDPFDDSVPVRAPAPSVPHSSLHVEQAIHNQDHEEESDRGPDIDRHPDFWFIDGSAVLLCGRTGFRVHAGVLRMHCAAFRELLPVRLPSQTSTRVSSPRSAASSNGAGSFRMGHTARTQSKAEMMMEVLTAGSPPRRVRREEPQDETIEGCPVLHLSDAPDDVVLFLRALYDRSFLQDKRLSSLFTIGAVLALARAYGAHSLLTELSRYLRTIYPSSLDAYTALYCPHPYLSRGREHDTSFVVAHAFPRDAHPLLALEIAARARLPAIAPTALLRAARVPLSEVFDGFALDDGRRVRAGQDTVRRVIEFREKLNALVEDALRRSTFEPRTCEACDGIGAENVRLFEAAVREKGLEAGASHSVRSMIDSGDHDMCGQCADTVEEWEEGVRGRVWRGVPIAAGEAGGWGAIERAAED
ncbi:unnamed protein product [Peniophora sp. CBMAI 1063]|nr:unnamed protein product [Peniophora sp. CBMAI 1063]